MVSKHGDHRACGLAHDALDQCEGMLGVAAGADERDIGMLVGSELADRADVRRADRDDVAEFDHELGEEGDPVLALVRDQDAQPVRHS